MNEGEVGQSMSHKGEKRKTYLPDLKLKAIATAKELGSNRKAAEKFKVDESRIRQWRKQETELLRLAQQTKRARVEGGGRKLTSEELEEYICSWVEEKRSQHLRVTRKMLKKKAADHFAIADSGPSTSQDSAKKTLQFSDVSIVPVMFLTLIMCLSLATFGKT